jgi:putative multicomponent Na+:H+ antiporter subunit B
MNSYDVYAIAVLLPISASMLIVQTNPYKALVIRGILGAVSALVYTILGAADVALTEALVGAFLATMLYAVAVRSSLVLRLGVVEEVAIAHDLEEELDKLKILSEQSEQSSSPQLDGQFQELSQPDQPTPPSDFEKLINSLKNTFSKHYMRVELVPYTSEIELAQALIDRNVHATLHDAEPENTAAKSYQIKIRLPRLYEIMQADLGLANVDLVYKK